MPHSRDEEKQRKTYMKAITLGNNIVIKVNLNATDSEETIVIMMMTRAS